MCIGMANGGKVMTPQEAIEIIDIAIAEVEWNYPMNYAVAFERAREALEKQIPKKPKERQGTTYSFCPCCNSNNIYEYCGDCGQKNDWSDTE